MYTQAFKNKLISDGLIIDAYINITLHSIGNWKTKRDMRKGILLDATNIFVPLSDWDVQCRRLNPSIYAA